MLSDAVEGGGGHCSLSSDLYLGGGSLKAFPGGQNACRVGVRCHFVAQQIIGILIEPPRVPTLDAEVPICALRPSGGRNQPATRSKYGVPLIG